jgi:hypothetical protein
MRFIPFLFVLLTAPVFGQLKWENPEQSFLPQLQDKQVVARFRFTNVGTMPVTINDVHTSCGCTTAALQKKQYAPGESGEIDATFQIAGRTGHQEKAIYVTTSSALLNPTVLRLKVDIPEALTIEPQLVMWRVGEPPQPKTIRIVVSNEYPGKIVSVEPDNQSVKLDLREIHPGKELEVKVTPQGTTQAAAATLLIRTNYPPANPETHYAYARVK